MTNITLNLAWTLVRRHILCNHHWNFILSICVFNAFICWIFCTDEPPVHTTRGVASGGKRVTECIGPRGLGGPPRDRLAIRNTGNSGLIAETRESSPILGAVFKLQRMRSCINTPKARSSAPRCIRQPRVKAERDQSPLFIRVKQRKTLDPFRCDTELLYSRVIWESLVMLAENSHNNEVSWKTPMACQFST